MNKQLFVIVTIILSIVLQSFVISADNTEFHELTVDHDVVQIDHVHIGYVSAITTFDVDKDVMQDCHHCGHCTSAQLSWELTANNAADDRFDNINGFSLQKFALKDVIESRLRPPIA